jgi:hypothetical protein
MVVGEFAGDIPSSAVMEEQTQLLQRLVGHLDGTVWSAIPLRIAFSLRSVKPNFAAKLRDHTVYCFLVTPLLWKIAPAANPNGPTLQKFELGWFPRR